MSFFGPMSKKRILQGIDEQILNKRYQATDTLISDDPLPDRGKVVRRLKSEIAQLRQLKDCLEPLLD
jgi:hypothetical protein